MARLEPLLGGPKLSLKSSTCLRKSAHISGDPGEPFVLSFSKDEEAGFLNEFTLYILVLPALQRRTTVPPEQSFFVDEQVEAQVLGVIKEAQKFATVVSPYLDLEPWQHANHAIQLAVQKGVHLQFIVRLDELDKPGGKSTRAAVNWLLENHVKVSAAEKLHAKIYMNEESVLLSSMNFTETSLNNLEVAFLLRDPRDIQRVRDYVTTNLMKIATPVDLRRLQSAGPQAELPSQRNVQVRTGHCIRCGRPHSYDPDKPLCETCYQSWAEWGNVEYKEKFCHSCGRPSEVSYARPLCDPCYQRQ